MPGRDAFCGWTGLGVRGMYGFMVSVFLSAVVADASPTTCAFPFLFLKRIKLATEADIPEINDTKIIPVL